MKCFKKMSATALCVGLLLTAGAVSAQPTETYGYNVNDDVKFPEMSHSYLKRGDFVNVANLKSLGLNQGYEQVRLLIGNPHFNEGFGSPKAFNYAFSFYTNQAAGEYVTCQYQVQFNEKHRVTGTFWKEHECEALLNPKKVEPKLVVRPITLGSDGLFEFGRSGMNDLQEKGRAHLLDVANQINHDFKTLKSVDITGYTDRIGSKSSNDALSLARANTVKAYFISKGVSASLIQVHGAGSTNAVVRCDGVKSAAVVACLMPNRRIELVVGGEM